MYLTIALWEIDMGSWRNWDVCQYAVFYALQSPSSCRPVHSKLIVPNLFFPWMKGGKGTGNGIIALTLVGEGLLFSASSFYASYLSPYIYRDEGSGRTRNWNVEPPHWSGEGVPFSPYPSRELWNSLQNSRDYSSFPSFRNLDGKHKCRGCTHNCWGTIFPDPPTSFTWHEVKKKRMYSIFFS